MVTPSEVAVDSKSAHCCAPVKFISVLLTSVPFSVVTQVQVFLHEPNKATHKVATAKIEITFFMKIIFKFVIKFVANILIIFIN